jgi:hypothetical protein
MFWRLAIAHIDAWQVAVLIARRVESVDTLPSTVLPAVAVFGHPSIRIDYARDEGCEFIGRPVNCRRAPEP